MRLINPKIYVIDDDQLYMQMLTKSLTNNSYSRVIGFNSVTESFSKIDAPDIIFLDYHLRDLNGLSSAKILKQTWKKTKIVLISNEFSLNKIRNPKKYGIDLLCAKSSDFDQFMAQIKQLQFKHIVSIFLKSTLISLSLITLYFLATLEK
jgi:DNA-binding NarL/FixJ family response regulator